MARVEYSDVVEDRNGLRAGVPISIIPVLSGSTNMWAASSGTETKSVVTNRNGVFRVWLDEGVYDVTPTGGETDRVPIIAFSSVGSSEGGAEKTRAEAKEKTLSEQITANTTAIATEKTARETLVPKTVALGNVSGTVALDLSKGTVFTATLTGNAELEATNIPERPTEFTVIVAQDATGGRTWSIKSVVWVGVTPSFKTTPETEYLVSLLSVPTALYGFGTVETALGSEQVLTANLKKESVTAEKLAPEAVSTAKLGALAVTTAKINSEAVGTSKIEKACVGRVQLKAEISNNVPLERGRTTELSGVTETTITAPNVTASKNVQVTIETAGTPVAFAIKERKAGENFVVKFASAFTGFVNWVVYE